MRARRRTERRKPIVGVGAMVVQRGRFLLIKRGRPPLKGRWMMPGGTVEWGETLAQAVQREILEETGLTVKARSAPLLVERIERDRRRVRRHFVIFDFECRYVKGKLRAGSDALDAMWADEVRLKQSDILPIVRELGLLSLRRSRRRRGR